jgi:hypothetical protein
MAVGIGEPTSLRGLALRSECVGEQERVLVLGGGPPQRQVRGLPWGGCGISRWLHREASDLRDAARSEQGVFPIWVDSSGRERLLSQLNGKSAQPLGRSGSRAARRANGEGLPAREASLAHSLGLRTRSVEGGSRGLGSAGTITVAGSDRLGRSPMATERGGRGIVRWNWRPKSSAGLERRYTFETAKTRASNALPTVRRPSAPSARVGGGAWCVRLPRAEVGHDGEVPQPPQLVRV